MPMRALLPRPLVRCLRHAWLTLLDARDRVGGGADELIPPRTLHFVGGGDYREVGNAFLGHFRAIGGLGPDEQVLDIGCGTGRMAVPLLGYLGERGGYTGFDISRRAIDWCAAKISARNPRFRFVHADIYNLEYNPHGTLGADAYRFPCGDASVDFAFATSVFTHMHAGEIRHYLAELRRVLKPQGRALLTFFICGEASTGANGHAHAAMDFRFAQGEGFTIDPQTPERAMGYREPWLRDALAGAGLAIDEPIRYGGWSGRADAVDFQDMVRVRHAAGTA